jgi:hypothetical protein
MFGWWSLGLGQWLQTFFSVTVAYHQFNFALPRVFLNYPLMYILLVGLSLWYHESPQVTPVERPSTPGWQPLVNSRTSTWQKATTAEHFQASPF